MEGLQTLNRTRLELPGGNYLEVAQAGSGSSLLFLHGGAGSISNWRHQIAAFQADHHVVALNLRGHGGSPWPGPSHVDDFFSDVLYALDTLPMSPRLALMGHSFGGYLATRLAVTRPERVAALGLFNTCGHLPNTPASRFLQLFSRRSDLLRYLWPGRVNAGPHVTFELMHRTLKEWQAWPLYSQLTMPVLVALGGCDLLIPLKLGRRMAGAIPRCRLEIVATAGHVLPIERPGLVNAWIRALLAEAFRPEPACVPPGSPG